jgi:hypothetical protein
MTDLRGDQAAQAKEHLIASLCSQCGGPSGTPISESDLAVLGDSHQVVAVSTAYGGGPIAVIGLRFAQRFAAQSVRGLAFCSLCRKNTEKIGNPFLLPKVCAGLGFLFGITLIGSPIALLLHVASFISLRRRLRGYREHPTISALKYALDAVGTLTVALLGNIMILAVLGGVVVYMVYFKR